MNKPIRREGFQPEATKPAAAAPEPQADAPEDQEQQEQQSIVETWPITVKLLNKPIRNNKNEEIREISFREPTGGDINRCGNPVRLGENLEILMDEKKMTLMIAALSGILSPNIDRMDPRDWCSCAYRLRGFFLPNFAAW